MGAPQPKDGGPLALWHEIPVESFGATFFICVVPQQPGFSSPAVCLDRRHIVKVARHGISLQEQVGTRKAQTDSNEECY